MTPKILIVDDEEVFRSQIKTYLEREFLAVAVAEHGEAALKMLDQVEPDIVILDVTMPLLDGLDTCKAIRARPGYAAGHRGIIMISGYRKEVADRVAGLETGADIYLVKPFEPRELLAQIKALWRSIQADRSPADWFVVDEDANFRINVKERQVEIRGKEVKLTNLEFEVLAYLARHASRPRTRSDLWKDVWNYDDDIGDNSIDQIILKLRKKLEPDPKKPRYIQAVHGVGFKLIVYSSRHG